MYRILLVSHCKDLISAPSIFMVEPNTKALIYAAASACSAAPLLMGMHGFALEDLSFAVHATGRVAFAFFLIVYFARPLCNTVGITALLKYRRTLGLCVALTLTVHFGFLAIFFSLSEESIFDDLPRLYTGSLGVVALYSMVATSNTASVRAMGNWWKYLHRFGIHYLWCFFFVSYVLAAQKEPHLKTSHALLFNAFLGVMILGVVLRASIWLRRRVPGTRSVTADTR